MKMYLVLEMSNPPTSPEAWDTLRDEIQGAASSVLCDINGGDSGDVKATFVWEQED